MRYAILIVAQVIALVWLTWIVYAQDRQLTGMRLLSGDLPRVVEKDIACPCYPSCACCRCEKDD